MTEEINIIINNLCTKFGTTIQNLVPEMARMNIAEGITTIIICAIIFICLYKISVKIWNYCKENDDFVFLFIPIFITGVVSFVFFISSIISSVGWIASPMAKTIKEILSMID